MYGLKISYLNYTKNVFKIIKIIPSQKKNSFWRIFGRKWQPCSKSHSGKWNLVVTCVREQPFLNLCPFSSSQSVTERFIKLLEVSSCFFWTRNFSETTHHKSFVFQSSPCGGLDEEGVPGWRHKSQPMCTSVGPCLLAEKIGKCSFVLFSHLWP